MQIYVLIATDGSVNGVYSRREQLIADLTSKLANICIDKIEIWEPDQGFVGYLKVNKQTIVSIEE